MPADELLPLTVCVADGPSRRLVPVALVVPFRGGGWALSVPFHPATTTLLTKEQLADDRIGEFSTPYEAASARYSATHRVKLSYHTDGFVQLSGAGVISGRYSSLAVPKAFGIFTRPLWDPVTTGPSFGVGVWGLQDYPTFNPDTRRQFLVLTPEDVFAPAAEPAPTNGYQVDFLVLPRHDIVNAGMSRGRPNIVQIKVFNGRPTPVPLRIIDWHTPHAFLGVYHFPMRYRFDPLSSGYVISSPRDASGHCVRAIAPIAPQFHEPSVDYAPGTRIAPLRGGVAGTGIVVLPTRTSSRRRKTLLVPGDAMRIPPPDR